MLSACISRPAVRASRVLCGYGRGVALTHDRSKVTQKLTLADILNPKLPEPPRNPMLDFDSHARDPRIPFAAEIRDADCMYVFSGVCTMMGFTTVKQRHALDLDNLSRLEGLLEKYGHRELVKLLMIRSAGMCGLSVGTNYKNLHSKMMDNDTEYLNAYTKKVTDVAHLASTLTVPTTAVMTGLTLGTAAGIAMSTMMPAATDSSVVAFPQAQLGFIPDGGAIHSLASAHHNIGHWLALTGNRISGYNLKLAGLATHCLSDGRLTILADVLNLGGELDLERLMVRLGEAETDPEPFVYRKQVKDIEKVFSEGTVSDMLARLKEIGTPWAKRQYARMRQSSPLGLAVTLRMLQLADHYPQHTMLSLEHRVARQMMMRPDFREGIEAYVLGGHRKPRWEFARVEDVPRSVVDDIILGGSADDVEYAEEDAAGEAGAEGVATRDGSSSSDVHYKPLPDSHLFEGAMPFVEARRLLKYGKTQVAAEAFCDALVPYHMVQPDPEGDGSWEDWHWMNFPGLDVNTFPFLSDDPQKEFEAMKSRGFEHPLDDHETIFADREEEEWLRRTRRSGDESDGEHGSNYTAQEERKHVEEELELARNSFTHEGQVKHFPTQEQEPYFGPDDKFMT
eukprot:TRINITY_DN1338_c0_g1_i1.p1 TRINITY_DN1338_c0_g1~~TRINITY_DN1338_c0_g1_i1.p1  ORF type:complete len:669 (+),score=189.47 TRINITY_DN1338_c0_g1_i1:140-2008(+)